MMEIIPAIKPKGINHLWMQLALVNGAAKRVQIDIVDGRYAPTASWPFNGNDDDAFRRIQSQEEGLPFWEDFEFELDLMIKDPELTIDDWINTGATTLIIHAGSTDNLAAAFSACEERGMETALAIKPSSDIRAIEPWVATIAFIQVMGNDMIGQSGMPLDPKAVETVRAVREAYPSLPVGVDIGVTPDTIGELHDAGATRFAATSAIFGGLSPKEAIAKLREAAAQ